MATLQEDINKLQTTGGQSLLNGGQSMFSGLQSTTQGTPTLSMSNPSVSAESLEQPVTPVTVPEPIIAPPVQVSPAVSNTAKEIDQIIAADTQEAADLRALRKEQAQLAGEESLASLFRQGQNQFQVPENMRMLRDIQLQLSDVDTASGITEARIQGGAGQTLGQAQREVTQEQRENAVRRSGLAAKASVLQGNIETATNLISQAVQTAYQDRTLRNTNLVNQINSLQSVVDDQTSQLLEKEKRQYLEDQAQITSAASSVNAATASGFATAQDIETMTALSGDPIAQKQYADKIVAKAARTQYLNKLAATQAAQSKAAAEAQTTAESIAKQTALSTTETIRSIDNIRNSPLGVKAATGGTAFGRTSISAGLESLDERLAGFGVLGLSQAPTAAIGGTLAAASQRTNVMSELSFMVNDATFSEMRRLKQEGVTFGSLTEGERIAIGRAADALFSSLTVNPDGTVESVNITEDKFYTLLDNYETKRLEFQNEVNRAAGQFDESDVSAIDNL